MRKRWVLTLVALMAAVGLVGCSVHVREREDGVDVEVKPVNITIVTDSEPRTQTASVELPMGAESLELTLNHRAGELRIDGEGAVALSGVIGFWQEPPAIRTQLSGSRYIVEIPEERGVTTIGGQAPRTELHLGARVPTRLEIRAGVGDAHIDLTRIPASELSVSAGVGTVTVLVPESRNVRVELTAGIGSNNLREAGFTKEGSTWLSPGFRRENVLAVRLEAGIGEFRLERR